MSFNTPTKLFHVTTGRKAKRYRQTGQIIGPVRGFDTITGAMAWAMKTGRKVVMEIYPVTPPHKLPDHHNAFGDAWWTDSVPMERVKCAYSAEEAWDKPEMTGDASGLPVVSVFLVMQFDPPTCSDSLLGVYLNRERAAAFAATHTHGPTPVRVEEWKDGSYGPTLR